MSLGMHKDSMLNLHALSMASENNRQNHDDIDHTKVDRRAQLSLSTHKDSMLNLQAMSTARSEKETNSGTNLMKDGRNQSFGVPTTTVSLDFNSTPPSIQNVTTMTQTQTQVYISNISNTTNKKPLFPAVDTTPSTNDGLTPNGRRKAAHQSTNTTSIQSYQSTMYAGFSYDYAENASYYVDPYATMLSTKSSSKNKNMFCCFFPNLSIDSEEHDEDLSDLDTKDSDSQTTSISQSDEKDKEAETKDVVDTTATTPDENDEGERTTKDVQEMKQTAEVIGNSIPPVHEPNKQDEQQETVTVTKPETGNERVETASTIESVESSSSGEENEVPADKVPTLKGILKKSKGKSKPIEDPNKGMDNSRHHPNNTRRNLFPTYEPRGGELDDSEHSTLSPVEKNVHFSESARVLQITSVRQMSSIERSMVWWQKEDYNDFKKAGRIITQAMLQGGSEIWLQTSNAWGKKQSSQNRDEMTQHSPEYTKALKNFGVTVKDSEDEYKEDEDDVGSKWWCKFGHSRRGLEHVVSIEEGRQRQRNVVNSIQAVMAEQRKQRITKKDPQRIAAVSMLYTSWARDLALAAGAADAEAVRSQFNSKAMSRIGFLQSKLRSINNNTDGRISAKFILSANSKALDAELLDANTHSSLMMKHKKNVVEESKRQEQDKDHQISKLAAGYGGTGKT